MVDDRVVPNTKIPLNSLRSLKQRPQRFLRFISIVSFSVRYPRGQGDSHLISSRIHNMCSVSFLNENICSRAEVGAAALPERCFRCARRVRICL
jgi:hypothetical protein